MASYKQQVLDLAAELGAIVETAGGRGRGPFEVLVNAPDGYQWDGAEVHQLVQSAWDNEPAVNLWKDALQRMRYGLSRCPDDCVCKETPDERT